METQETTTPKTKSSRKKSVKTANPDTGTFIVKSKGYKEQFSSLDAAKRAYGRLKKKKSSEGERFKIELLKKEKNGSLETIEEIEMSPEA